MCPKMDFLGDKSRIRNDRCVSYRCRSPRCSCIAMPSMMLGHRARLRGGRIAGDDVLVSRRRRIAAAGSGSRGGFRSDAGDADVVRFVWARADRKPRG